MSCIEFESQMASLVNTRIVPFPLALKPSLLPWILLPSALGIFRLAFASDCGGASIGVILGLRFGHVFVILDDIPRVIPSTDTLQSPKNASEKCIKHWDERGIEILVRTYCLVSQIWARFGTSQAHDPLLKQVVAKYKEMAESLGLTLRAECGCDLVGNKLHPLRSIAGSPWS